MSDIFQEVEEDVRREQYEKLWKQYGNYVIAAATVLILGVAAYQAWRNYELGQRQKISDQYEAAMQSVNAGDMAKAETAFSALQNSNGGYATLAKLQLATAQLAQGKREPAVALLKELTGNSDPVVSSAARLKLAWAQADALGKPEIDEILKPLSAADSPWRFSAAEILAYVDFRTGAVAAAHQQYAKLAQEQQASASLRQRATAIAEYLKANAAPGTIPDAPAPPPSLPALTPAPSAPPATAPAQGTTP